MSEYIERDKLPVKQIVVGGPMLPRVIDVVYIDDIAAAPAANVVETSEAEWIESPCGFNMNYSDNYHCSKCGNHEKLCTRFCSWCGSSMKDHDGFYWRRYT